MPPTHPRLTIRVGITGHRHDKLPAETQTALSREIGRVFDVVERGAEAIRLQYADAYANEPSVVRLVSAIAEGADRFAAEVALERGHQLACVLPFMREEYARDFQSPDSIQEYQSLLKRASTVLELDGPGGKRGEAYHDAGRLIVRHCDVLIAVWDGQPAEGQGGTAEIVAYARDLEMPVVWIDANAPHHSAIIADASRPRGSTRAITTLSTDLKRILLPPAELRDTRPPVYDAPPRGAWLHVGIFRGFRAVIALGRRRHHDAGPTSAANTTPSDLIDHEFDRADRLAIHFGEFYRDSFVMNYVLGAVAVAAAVWGSTAIELAPILIILIVTARGRRSRWHERWLGYRLLGEQFRHMRFLRPIAVAPPPVRPTSHTGEADAEAQWGLWLLQARVREMPMLDARFDQTYLARFRDQLAVAIHEQRRYHTAAGENNSHLHHRLHRFGAFLFILTAVICVAHFYLEWRPFEWIEHRNGQRTLSRFAAWLPALAAAIAGINNHGEFDRVSNRSRAMVRSLGDLAHELETEKELRSKTLARVAEQAASLMSDELREWQYLSWGRPISLPS